MHNSLLRLHRTRRRNNIFAQRAFALTNLTTRPRANTTVLNTSRRANATLQFHSLVGRSEI